MNNRDGFRFGSGTRIARGLYADEAAPIRFGTIRPCWRIMLAAILIFITISYTVGLYAQNAHAQGEDQNSTSDMKHLYYLNAADDVDRYNIAKRDGQLRDQCTQAQTVAQDYLGAKNESKYRTWKAIEKSDCEAADQSGH
jgi:hypothetical protein